jgi:hypothetical protein
MSEQDVRAFIRRRNKALRGRLGLVLLSQFAIIGLIVWALSRYGPLFEALKRSPEVVLLCAGFVLPSALLITVLAKTFRPLRYRDGALVAHRTLPAAIGHSFGMILLGLGGVWVAIWAWPDGRSILIGLLSPLVVASGVLRLPGVFDRRPTIVINSDGFFDRRQYRVALKWEQIGRMIHIGNRSSWPVFLVDDNPADRTLMRRLYGLLGFPYLYVDLGAVDCSGGDVLLAINQFAPQLVASISELGARRRQPA